MQCVFLEVEVKEKVTEEVTDKGKEKVKEKVITKTCQARIGTSGWKPDADTIDHYCEKKDFEDCPRLHVFMNHAIGTSKLKIETK